MNKKQEIKLLPLPFTFISNKNRLEWFANQIYSYIPDKNTLRTYKLQLIMQIHHGYKDRYRDEK